MPAEEIDLSNDIVDFQKLTADERYFILHVLAFSLPVMGL